MLLWFSGKHNLAFTFLMLVTCAAIMESQMGAFDMNAFWFEVRSIYLKNNFYVMLNQLY